MVGRTPPADRGKVWSRYLKLHAVVVNPKTLGEPYLSPAKRLQAFDPQASDVAENLARNGNRGTRERGDTKPLRPSPLLVSPLRLLKWWVRWWVSRFAGEIVMVFQYSLAASVSATRHIKLLLAAWGNGRRAVAFAARPARTGKGIPVVVEGQDFALRMNFETLLKLLRICR
jgi:hypothetical protein